MVVRLSFFLQKKKAISYIFMLIFIIYWLEQIQAILGEKNKPILIVGTHADKAQKDPNIIMQSFTSQLNKNPVLAPGGNEVIKSFCVSMATGLGLNDLKSCLVDVALTHPRIGIHKVKATTPLVALQHHVQYLVTSFNRVHDNPIHYMEWEEFVNLCVSKHILLFTIT